MASFLDTTVTDVEWVDLYTVLGIPANSTIQFQNKGSIGLLYMEAVAKPATNSTSGIVIPANSPKEITQPLTGEKIWVKALNTSDSSVDSTIVAVLMG